MSPSRRTVLKLGTGLAAATLVQRASAATFDPRPSGWQHYEITTEVEIAAKGGPVDLWIPVPSVDEAAWMRPGETSWTGNAARAEIATDPVYGARFVHATWDGAEGPARLSVTSSARTRDRSVDLGRGMTPVPLTLAERALYTGPTDLIPTDGIVRETARMITAGAQGDLDAARRIYHWVVEQTVRDPETRGCGIGDVGSMLATGNLAGKCADLNALYVGLARSVGLPARDVYGLRVAKSDFGYRSLGAASPDVTKAQHCRAEVYLEDHGWVPVDPADVRKVMLEEPPKDLSLDHPKVVAARDTLFGAWEGNWIAYNFAHDLSLPGAEGWPVEFLMYPQAEIAGERLDPLSPDSFAYTITARDLSA